MNCAAFSFAWPGTELTLTGSRSPTQAQFSPLTKIAMMSLKLVETLLAMVPSPPGPKQPFPQHFSPFGHPLPSSEYSFDEKTKLMLIES